MRFKWRSHLAVTALAAFSLLPFAGCSSQQQQQQGEEVEASEQGGQEGSEENANAQANAQGENGSEEQAATNAEGDSANANNSGEEMVTNEVMTNDVATENQAAAGDGDLAEIINEMGNGGAPAATNAAIPVEEGVPMATEEIPSAEPANAFATEGTAPAAAPPEVSPGAVSGLPEMGSKMPYVVEAGDTLGKLAARIYGDQTKWRDISNLTGLSNPNHIFPGDVVYYSLDESSAQFAATYASLQRSKETVRDGDTLASIAKRVYGSSRSWRHIWRQNDNIDNPDKLTAGMTIYYINKDSIKSAFNKLLKSDNIVKKLNKNNKFNAQKVKTATVLRV